MLGLVGDLGKLVLWAVWGMQCHPEAFDSGWQNRVATFRIGKLIRV